MSSTNASGRPVPTGRPEASWSPRAGEPAPPAVPQRRPPARTVLGPTTPPEPSSAPTPQRHPWRAPVAQLLALAALTLTSAAVIDHRTAQIAADLAAEHGQGPRLALADRVIHAAAPVAVEIPALHEHSSLIDLRRQPDGTLQVPTDPAQAGWYVGSSHPGDPGPTVLAGHVDSKTGPGAFYHLDHLKPGDRIVVQRADRSALTFVVTRTMRVPKRHFPTALVYVGDRSPSLRLISCGGDFDRSSGHYLDNVVVLASPLVHKPAKQLVPTRVPAPRSKLLRLL